MTTSGSLTGKLLVATPTLEEPNFHRTVVLILAHGDEGALGVVLNRPSELDASEPLPEWAPLALHPQVLFIGGPVMPDAVICLGLAERGGGAEGFAPVFDGIGVVDLHRGPERVAADLSGIRVFAGYAGWDPDQLESEIDAGGWFVVDPITDDAISRQSDELWRAVLRRQDPKLAIFANSPPRLSFN